MIDPITERQYSDCCELMELWRRYHDFFKIAVAGKEITPEKEHEFITVKSRIAMLHDSFMDCLEHDQSIGQNVLSIVTRSITLKHVHRMSTAEIKKIELEWHESYLLLNEIVGLLEDKRRQFAEITPSQYYRGQFKKKVVTNVKQFLQGWVFKALIVVVVLTIGIFAAIQYDLMGWLFKNPTTRNFIVKWEDLIRVAYKDYPFRELSVFTRRDKLPPTGVKFGNMSAQEQPKYAPKVGIARARAKIGGSKWDFTKELATFTECRAEIYIPTGMFGGGECVLWLYRMPSSSVAKSIERKYQGWNNAVGVTLDPKPDWVLFRRANVIGLAFGGDTQGQVRRWLLVQYARIKEKRR